MLRAPCFCLLVCLYASAQQAPIPMSTELPGSPFFVKHTWFIGGAGSWDYVTLDAAAHLLYIAHDRVVQVVDVTTGTVAGVISGFRQAYAVALDDDGEYGYVSDGPAGAVNVFDRNTLKVEAAIPVYCSPRSLAFEPRSRLVFAVCGNVSSAPPQSVNSPGGAGTSHVVAIDSQTRRVVADIVTAGDLRFAEADGVGHVYISAGSAQFTTENNGKVTQDSVPQRILRLDAPSIAIAARRQMDEPRPAIATGLGVNFDGLDQPRSSQFSRTLSAADQ